MLLGCNIYHLHRDSDPVCRFPDASLNNCADAEFLTNLRDVLLLLLVIHNRSSCDYLESFHESQVRDQFLREPVDEEVIARVRADIDERKYGDSVLVEWGRRPGQGRRLPGGPR